MNVSCMTRLPEAYRDSVIVYHGSSSNFKRLRIDKKLSHRLSTETNEGFGIYFSTDVKVAESYGNYIYVLEVNKEYFRDFRRKGVCVQYLSQIRKVIKEKSGVDIQQYISFVNLANYMYWGGIAICGVGREIYLLLDSEEKWHTELKQTKKDKVYSTLRYIDKHVLKAYMFNYNIKNIGIIRDVSDNVVRIIDKYKIVY